MLNNGAIKFAVEDFMSVLTLLLSEELLQLVSDGYWSALLMAIIGVVEPARFQRFQSCVFLIFTRSGYGYRHGQYGW